MSGSWAASASFTMRRPARGCFGATARRKASRARSSKRSPCNRAGICGRHSRSLLGGWKWSREPRPGWISVIDNLRAAVTRADWHGPEINPKVEEFCRHYGTVMMPTRPAMPRHKGKIEAGVKYSQNNAIKGRLFASLAGQNLFLSDWERTVADTRIQAVLPQAVRHWTLTTLREKLIKIGAKVVR